MGTIDHNFELSQKKEWHHDDVETKFQISLPTDILYSNVTVWGRHFLFSSFAQQPKTSHILKREVKKNLLKFVSGFVSGFSLPFNHLLQQSIFCYGTTPQF